MERFGRFAYPTDVLDIGTFLADHGIAFERFDHAAVFTVEESLKLPPMPGFGTKNLFLRDGKDKRHFLIVVGHEKKVDLKELRSILNADKLSFASPERLMEFLGVEPGSATVLGLANDTTKHVEVVFDEAVWNADSIQCHPLVNTATLVIPHDGLETFLEATGHAHRAVDLPARSL